MGKKKPQKREDEKNLRAKRKESNSFPKPNKDRLSF